MYNRNCDFCTLSSLFSCSKRLLDERMRSGLGIPIHSNCFCAQSQSFSLDFKDGVLYRYVCADFPFHWCEVVLVYDVFAFFFVAQFWERESHRGENSVGSFPERFC